MEEKEVQEVVRKINEILQEHDCVLGVCSKEEVELRLRKREAEEAIQEINAYDQELYISQDGFNQKERLALDAWGVWAKEEQAKIFPLEGLRGLPRLANVEFKVRMGFYDGPLTGLCTHDGRWAYYACVEECKGTLMPRHLCLWYLDDEWAPAAENYYTQLLNSNWQHLAYKDGKTAGNYLGGDYPTIENKKELEEHCKSLSGWVRANFSKLSSYEKPAAYFGEGEGQVPDGWFTYADTSKRENAREEELEWERQLILDSVIEDFDMGAIIRTPDGQVL